MTADATLADRPATPAAISSSMTLLLATACGLIAANLYYAQPLAGPIAAELGLSPSAAGLIVTMTQVGYGLGLLLVVPLGDLLENRRLVLALLGLNMLALLAGALATQALPFFTAAVAIGISASVVQILVPYASHMATDANRGRVVGNVMGGLMAGIMLARPAASLIAAASSWHAVFEVSMGVMALLALVLWRLLPARQPATRAHYGQLLASLVHLVRTTPLLRRRAFYQCCQFGAFSLFWTTTPLLLASPAFGLSQRGIALFALAGAAGAVAAPFAGRVADRGWTRPATVAALGMVGTAFLITHIPGGRLLALGLLVAAAILLDFGVQTNVVLGQRALFTLGAEYRSRLNGLYIASFFAAGALGSALGGWAFARGGWELASWVGLAFPAAGLLYFLTEPRR